MKPLLIGAPSTEQPAVLGSQSMMISVSCMVDYFSAGWFKGGGI